MSDVIPATARRERTRQRLLDAAAQVFAEVGLDAASVEAICETAGFTRGAFYSNFDSKDELFLELTERFSGERLAAVSKRVRELESAPGRLGRPADIVGRLLDIEHDDRTGVLLLSEIRNRALRDPALAVSFLAWEDAMTTRVAELVDEIVLAAGIELRIPTRDIARLFLVTWETAAQRAAMAGLDNAELCAAVEQRMSELAEALVS